MIPSCLPLTLKGSQSHLEGGIEKSTHKQRKISYQPGLWVKKKVTTGLHLCRFDGILTGSSVEIKPRWTGAYNLNCRTTGKVKCRGSGQSRGG